MYMHTLNGKKARPAIDFAEGSAGVFSLPLGFASAKRDDEEVLLAWQQQRHVPSGTACFCPRCSSFFFLAPI